VEEYCKKLLQTCAKDGGFILTTSTTGYGENDNDTDRQIWDGFVISSLKEILSLLQ